jgi:hypothetical protein
MPNALTCTAYHPACAAGSTRHSETSHAARLYIPRHEPQLFRLSEPPSRAVLVSSRSTCKPNDTVSIHSTESSINQQSPSPAFLRRRINVAWRGVGTPAAPPFPSASTFQGIQFLIPHKRPPGLAGTHLHARLSGTRAHGASFCRPAGRSKINNEHKQAVFLHYQPASTTRLSPGQAATRRAVAQRRILSTSVSC